MAEQSAIGWTNATWNPWHGCIKISDGCKNCYMYRDKERYGQDPRKVVRSKTTFNDPLKWKEPRMIFTCSWSDFFIAEADAWREDAWNIIRATPQHTYQILTKRPERIADHLPSDWGDGYPNVWLGVSAETQETFNQRWPHLANAPAAIRWISFEPLLGLIDPAVALSHHVGRKCGHVSLDWAVFGGESGSEFREMQMDWLREPLELCRKFSTKVYTKQDSGFKPGLQGNIPDELWIHEFPRSTVRGA